VIDGDAWLHPGDLALFEQSVSSGGIALTLSGLTDGSMGISELGANTRKWVKLGSRDTGYNFKGHILAVLVYDRELTGSEANTVRQYPPLKLIIGSLTTSAAITVGGLALIVLPTVIVGNELVIMGGVAASVGLWFLAHRHGQLRGQVDANTETK
jgi:hypothetical protein